MRPILDQDLQNILEAYTYITEGDVIGRAYRQVKSDREYGNIEKGDDLRGPYNIYKQAQDRASRLDRGFKGKVPIFHAVFAYRVEEAGIDIATAVDGLLNEWRKNEEISVSVLKDWHMSAPELSCIVLKGYTSNLLDWYPVDAFTHVSGTGERTSEYALDPMMRKHRDLGRYDEGVIKLKDANWKTFSIYMNSDINMDLYMGDFFEAKKILEEYGLKQSDDPGQTIPEEPSDYDDDW